jgi:dTDP-4-dehydrorhamnose reductase
MTILVTGGDNSLSQELGKIYEEILIPDLKELDLTNKESIKQFFSRNNFDCIIHNESLMNVRECEEDKDKAKKINVTSTKNLVDIIQEITPKIEFIHVSTPCIFDGVCGMFTETSIPNPVNYYGITRMDAENEVKKLQEFVIIRTNYVDKGRWPYPKAFTDRFGTYLFSKQVAQGIFDIRQEGVRGIMHVVSDTKISMYELAKMTTPEIEPMTINDYSGPPVTMDMSLESTKWKKYKISLN